MNRSWFSEWAKAASSIDLFKMLMRLAQAEAFDIRRIGRIEHNQGGFFLAGDINQHLAIIETALRAPVYHNFGDGRAKPEKSQLPVRFPAELADRSGRLVRLS